MAGCYRLSVSEKVNILAMAEMIIEGKAVDGQIIPKELWLVESSDSLRNTKMLMARSLVYIGAKTPIRVINITEEDNTPAQILQR